MRRRLLTPLICGVCVLGLASAASPAFPRLSLDGKGDCRFNLASPASNNLGAQLPAFHCEGEYRVTTEGNELSASLFDFDGVHLTASGNVRLENASEQLTVQGSAMEYDFAARTVRLTGGVHLTAKGYTAKSESLTLAQDTGQLELSGRVLISRGSESLEAQSVQISRDGRLVAKIGVILKGDEAELRCQHLEESENVFALTGDVWVRARVADSEIAFTAHEGEFRRDSGIFRLHAVYGAFPAGDLRANELELNLKAKMMRADGEVSGTFQERRFAADSIDFSFDPFKISLSGRVRIWIPREEFRR